MHLVAACGSSAIKPSERDTTGQYDGLWVGRVSEPRASRVELSGSWYTKCDWEPFEVRFVVEDGRIRLRRDSRNEFNTPVAGDGRFHLERPGKMATGRIGTLPGNGKAVYVYTGSLAEDGREGWYKPYVTSMGTGGCSAKMTLEAFEEGS
ncbi:MAG: hypothetical protein CSB44_09560 [Gammaproteobacteria bacterium]|nr:MAG: hypothetical protein CSB44_09560 [Gammaproteobacteria bacterium]